MLSLFISSSGIPQARHDEDKRHDSLSDVDGKSDSVTVSCLDSVTFGSCRTFCPKLVLLDQIVTQFVWLFAYSLKFLRCSLPTKTAQWLILYDFSWNLSLFPNIYALVWKIFINLMLMCIIIAIINRFYLLTIQSKIKELYNYNHTNINTVKVQ